MFTNASKIIQKCGGHGVIAKWLRLDVSAIYKYEYPKRKGGTDGLIPARHHPKIIEKAKAAGVILTPADFFPRAEGSA